MTGKPVARTVRKHGPIYQALTVLASLQLTVVLFVFGILIVFFGTLAQRPGLPGSGIWTVVSHYFRSYHIWVPLQIFFPIETRVGGGFPFPGGWLIGSLLLANLLAAHAIRFKLSWKRSGILLIHAGLIIMMVSELTTGLFAVEGQMAIDEGGSSNAVIENRHSELAIIDSSNPKADDVVVVPGSLLKKGGTISNDLLPFDVEVVRFLINSDLKAAKGQADNPATTGAGREKVAVEQDEESGASQTATVDVPSAYVTLRKKGNGQPLGTYLVSILVEGQDVAVDGKNYNVALRFKQTYRPFALHLKEFRFDRYIGTNTPKNYSSRVRLVDPEMNVDREVLIKMNDPLRYRGETFYQADFDKKTEKTTYLQVVHNPGWQMPYISCAVVALGMLVHFGQHLLSFLRLRAAQ